MTSLNQSRLDRTIRAIAGIVLLFAAWTVSSTAAGVTVLILGAMALGTAAVGWCPTYSLFGLSTLKKPAGQCPNCARDGAS